MLIEGGVLRVEETWADPDQKGEMQAGRIATADPAKAARSRTVDGRGQETGQSGQPVVVVPRQPHRGHRLAPQRSVL